MSTENLKTLPEHDLVCPYCGMKAKLVESEKVYGKKYGGKMVYICGLFPKCDSIVGVHPGTTVPLGSLANRNLRKKRKGCHQIFDQLWKEGILKRGDAYVFLAWFMGMSENAHIGEFTIEQCEEFISRSDEIGEYLAVFYRYKDY